MINFDRFLASFINEMEKYQPISCYYLPACIKKALEDQGLEYKDGEIVKTQRRISAEAKENGYGESEDEKIRTALIHFFSNSENTSFEYWEGISKKEVLDWLEKQSVHANFRRKIQIGDKVTRNKDGILVNISQLDRVAKKHKKQGKQKPVEWKQENREELTEFENAMMHIGGSFFGENAGLDPNDTATIKEQAELLLELAPKTEWSEEDEKMFDYALDMIEWYSGKNGDKSKLVSDWLKSLKDKVQSKPQWKPNGEQLYILNWLANVKLGDSVVEQEVSKHLNELLEELKKLKG